MAVAQLGLYIIQAITADTVRELGLTALLLCPGQIYHSSVLCSSLARAKKNEEFSY